MAAAPILVAGLSPAWQQILRFRRLRLGEVNRAAESYWCASGKVLNVARACHALGAPTIALTVLGGLTGQAIAAEFRGLDLQLDWIDSGSNTRVCTTILDEQTQLTTELVENAGAVASDALERFQRGFSALAVGAGLVVFTGSLPQGTPATFVHDLLRCVQVPIVLDIRGPELEACLPLLPYLVKPNQEELLQTYRVPEVADSGLPSAIQKLLAGGARHGVISQGAHGLILASQEGTIRMRPPRIETVNPIGCGDCLAAGIAVGTLEGKDITTAVRLGIGAAAQNASQLLPARIDRRKSEEFSQQVQVTPLFALD